MLCCSHVYYSCKCLTLFNRYVDGKNESYYYSLTWTFSFPRARDTVYFAHCYPYTYSDLQVS